MKILKYVIGTLPRIVLCFGLLGLVLPAVASDKGSYPGSTADYDENSPTVPLSSPGYSVVKLDWHVIPAGGCINGSSSICVLSGSIGQISMGSGCCPDYGIFHGFWQDESGEFICDCLPGDANNDGMVNVGDGVYIVNHVFEDGPAPEPYPICSGDANGDCVCNIGDAVSLVNHVFKNGMIIEDCEAWLDICGKPLRK